MSKTPTPNLSKNPDQIKTKLPHKNQLSKIKRQIREKPVPFGENQPKKQRSEETKDSGEKCGWCMSVMRKRRSWGGSKPLDHAHTVEAKCRLWMLRPSGSFAFFPCASRSRESISALSVPGAWSCTTNNKFNNTSIYN